LKAITSCGGHLMPNSTLGEILLWKNAQKNEVKNNTSDTINNNIPTCNPTVTWLLWFPCSIVSENTFFHHLKEVKVKMPKVIDNVKLFLLFIHKIIDNVKQRAEIEPIKGQGLFSTMWYGWNFFSILIFCSVQSD